MDTHDICAWWPRPLGNIWRWVALLAIGQGEACSLQDFDYLSKAGAPSVGGSNQSGGIGGQEQQGGSMNLGGSENTSSSTSAGGSTPVGGSASVGGSANTNGGSTLGGTSSAATTSSGGTDLSGCALAQTGGDVLVPPSQGFETDIASWSTTSGNTAALKRVAGNGANCEGDWYMSCDGTRRQAAWDGPALEIASYVTIGHSYLFTAAVRQSPSVFSGSAVSMKLVVSETCSTTSYQDLIQQVVAANWVRLSGQFTGVVPSGCTTPTSVRLYIASLETGTTFASFDVDDFRLIDLTPSATTGTGGATGAGATATASPAAASGEGATAGAGGARSVM